MTHNIICAWCGAPIAGDAPIARQAAGGDPAPVSHGICGACTGEMLDVPVTDVYDLDGATMECLPFGVVELDADATIRHYNRAEAQLSGLDPEQVIGRNFFSEVAPCTRDTIVEERFDQLLASGGGAADLSFVFRFLTGHRLVRILMLVDGAEDRRLLLVQDQTEGETPDRGGHLPTSG